MAPIKSVVEAMFGRLGHGIFRHRIKVLFFMALLIGGLASQIPFLSIDTSFEGMLRENHPDRLALNRFRDQFKGSELIVLMIKAPDIFDREFLATLKHFHEDIEQKVPFINKVNSLINARRLSGSTDTLDTGALFRDWPEKPLDLEAVKHYVTGRPFFVNHLISEDRRYTAIILETKAIVYETTGATDDLSDFSEKRSMEKGFSLSGRYFSEKENTRVVEALEKIIGNYENPRFSISVTGSPMVVESYNRCTRKDIPFLTGLSTLVMIVFLFILFRRISGVVFPFIVVQSALVSTMGLMSIGQASISIMTIILPSFLIAVGVADAIHILTIFFERFNETHDKEASIAYAMSHSGLAVVMTSLTTAAGLLSFSWAELSAIGDLGIYAAAGVILALVYTVVLLPALLAVTPIKTMGPVQTGGRGVVYQILLFFERLSTGHPGKIVMVSTLVCAVSVYFAFRITLSHDTLEYFPDSFEIKKDLHLVDQHLKGNVALDILMDTRKKDGVCDPRFLSRLEKKLDDISELTVDGMGAGKIFSMIDILKEIHQALHEDNIAFYRVPESPKMIAQELFLFENTGSDDLSRFVDSEKSILRILVKIPWVDLVVTGKYLETIKKRLENEFGDSCDITATGLTGVMARILPIALSCMTKSYMIAFFVISLLMIVLAGDLKTGLVSMAPNLLPILTALGIMGMAHIPMDLSALMIGSIAMGLVVDDTMHFIYQYRKNIEAGKGPVRSISITMAGTGRAMVVTSLVLGGNFLVYTLATLHNLVVLGSMTALIIILALFSDFLVTPALLILLDRRS